MTHISDAIAGLQSLANRARPLTDSERAEVARFLGAVDRVCAADPHILNRIQEALTAAEKGMR